MSAARQDVGEQLIALLPNMRRFAWSLARKEDVADDLVQQACERALTHAGSFAPGTRFDAWMFHIIRNLWIDKLRKERTAGIPEEIDAQHNLVGEDGETVTSARLALAGVSEAIERLPLDQREVLMLVCVEDFSYRDAADVLGVPIGTVMSRLARARRKLAELTGISANADRSPDQRDR